MTRTYHTTLVRHDFGNACSHTSVVQATHFTDLDAITAAREIVRQGEFEMATVVCVDNSTLIGIVIDDSNGLRAARLNTAGLSHDPNRVA